MLILLPILSFSHATVGSVCTTRKKTGVGYPQLSAVIECADAAHGLGGHIISVGACAHSSQYNIIYTVYIYIILYSPGI